MQVFVPLAELHLCPACLDNQRLNKQALEMTQLLNLHFEIPTQSGTARKGWRNHPALEAWRMSPGGLLSYLIHNIDEIEKRGYKAIYYKDRLREYQRFAVIESLPVWWGDERVHSSHRSRLLQKGFESKLKGSKNANQIIAWYANFGWPEMKNPNLFEEVYLWPTLRDDGQYDLEIRMSKEAIRLKEALITAFGSNPYL